MKQLKFVVLALTVLMGISFTSCISSDESKPTGGGVVQVTSSYWSTSVTFLADDGITLVPTATSVDAVESQVGFTFSDTKVAYITFEYDPDSADNADSATSKKLVVTLTGAVPVDAYTKVESTYPGASNDSISTSPIIRLDDVKNSKPMVLLGDGYLLTGINYFLSSYTHRFTLVNYAEENSDSEIVFHLRHTGTPEESNSYTSEDLFYYYGPHYYYFAFDIRDILNPYRDMTSSVRITIIADVNTSNSVLDSSTPEQSYSIDYALN